MQLFFEPQLLKTQCLDENDSKHCVKVLRKKKGDEIQVLNGQGSVFTCRITDPNPRACRVEVVKEEIVPRKQKRWVHIAIAPTKNADRLAYFLEKAVELGVQEITLLETKHSERRVQKMERLEKVAVSAMKQSLQTWAPILHEITPFEEFVQNKEVAKTRFIAHLSDSAEAIEHTQLSDKVCILIGPEGDFSDFELDLAKQCGWTNVFMGNSRLRTETAGVVAASLLTILN
jgi:16S rRNA (uracil1498-N3)-methyltransferase